MYLMLGPLVEERLRLSPKVVQRVTSPASSSLLLALFCRFWVSHMHCPDVVPRHLLCVRAWTQSVASATLAWFSHLPEARCGGPPLISASLLPPWCWQLAAVSPHYVAELGCREVKYWDGATSAENFSASFLWGSVCRAWTQPPVASSNLRLFIFGERIWIRETKSLEEGSKLRQSK